MRALWKSLPQLFRGSLSRDIVTVASGNALAQVFQLIGTPILMLLYNPADYGLYAIYLSVVSVFAVFSSLRYDFAVLIATSRRTAFTLVALSGVLLISWSGFLALLLGGIRSLLPPQALASLPVRYMPYVPFGVLLTALYALAVHYVTRMQAYRALRAARVLYGLATVISQGLLFLVFGTTVGLIVGDALGRLAGISVLFHLIVVDWRSQPPRVTLRGTVSAARRYARFPRYLVATDLLSAISRNAPVAMLATVFGTDITGIYAQAQRLAGAPLMLLGQAVASVYSGRLSSVLRTNAAELPIVFRDVTVRLVVIAVVAVAAIAALAALLPLIVDSEWQELRTVMIVLLPSFFALFVASPVAPSLALLNRQHVHLLWELARLGAVVASIAAGVGLGAPFHTVLLSYSVVLAVCLSALYGLCYRNVKIAGRGQGR